MAKKNKAYWKERFAALEEEQYERSADYYNDVQKQFREASNNIQRDVEHWYQRLADNNGISYMSARKFLKDTELKEFKWTVEQYIKAGEENAIDGRWIKELENASARYHISYLEAMKLQAQQHAELLSTQYEGGMTDFLHKSYSENYYRQAYEIAKGTGVGANLRKLDSAKVDSVIKRPWAQDEANFSDRIWSNKKKLVQNLHTELTQSIIRGAPPGKAIDSLAKTMEVSKRQAGTLIMTESAAISSKAQQDCFRELGVEEFEVIETLDGNTCELCQEMDGKHFPMTEFKVGETAPPFHPRCRGCTCPYFDDEFTIGEERAARDEKTGQTIYVNGNLSYPEWKKVYIEPGEADNVSDRSPFDYLIRDHKEARNTAAEKLVLNEAVAAIPEKVQAALQTTIIEVGHIGASQYDYDRDILYVAKGAEKEDVIHEIGHMVECKMIDNSIVETLKQNILKNVSPLDFVNETYYNAAGEPIEIFLIRSDRFISEYQGRVYINDWSELLDDDMRVKPELVAEFISEPFREYIENPKRLQSEFSEFYNLIKEAVE